MSIARRNLFRSSLRRAVLAAGLAAGAFPCILVNPAQAQSTSERTIQGKVFAANGSLQSGAIVYLKDIKSLEIKTYISTQDGAFRFGQLGGQDDYQVWAEFGGHKSKIKTISSFDSKKLFLLSLHIEEK
jgi:hypothetical protein